MYCLNTKLTIDSFNSFSNGLEALRLPDNLNFMKLAFIYAFINQMKILLCMWVYIELPLCFERRNHQRLIHETYFYK